MDKIKLQKELLATILKKKNNYISYYKDFSNKDVWVCFNGLRVYALDMYDFYIDLDNAECREFSGIKSILEEQNEGYYLEFTNELKQLDKKTCAKLHCDHFDTWIDKDFIKYFKDLEKLTFKAKGSTGVVFVFENSILSAIICPVNIKE